LLLWPSFKLNSKALMVLVHVILVFLRPNHLEAIILSHSHHRCGLRFDSKLKTLGAFKILGFTSLCFQVFLLYIIVVLGFLVSHYVHHCCLSFEFKGINVCDSTCMVISFITTRFSHHHCPWMLVLGLNSKVLILISFMFYGFRVRFFVCCNFLGLNWGCYIFLFFSDYIYVEFFYEQSE
jgi:hypothetical protein